VVTSEDGRAELQFDDGSVTRLTPNSSLTLTVLRGQVGSSDAEIVLQSGLDYFELEGDSASSRVQVRFGDCVVTANGFTVLRIGLDNPPGELAVFSGNAHLERGSAMALDLHGGESVTLNAADPSQYVLSESIWPDSWDAWNSDQDQSLNFQETARTGAVNNMGDSKNPAWNDLDANGNWYNVPGQGTVWSPYEAANAGWDPYGDGNFMWTPRFGYMWVSGYSWGYMPFQCGSWNYYDDFGWGWSTGMGMGPGMGMCQPWWGGGGWYSNIGYGPHGYRPPLRPRPIRPGGGGLVAVSHPVVPIHRASLSSGAGSLPVRDRNTPVTIAGHVVQPLRPLSPRPQYQRTSMGQTNSTRPGYLGVRTPTTAGHPTSSTSAIRPSQPRPSGGSQPAPSHYSGGGSSGGGGAPRGGGGGGGGGGHSGGGGGHR
jgi:hypothetical protein